MLLKNRFLLAGLFLLLAVLLSVWFTPFAVAHGVRWWIWWRARQEGFNVNIDKIDAPFLRPVVIRQLLHSLRPNGLFLLATIWLP